MLVGKYPEKKFLELPLWHQGFFFFFIIFSYTFFLTLFRYRKTISILQMMIPKKSPVSHTVLTCS